MSKETTRTEKWNAPIDDCYQVLSDYSSYPHFVPGVKALEVLSQDEHGACVLYSINIIKSFQYILDLSHQRPEHISWTLKNGDLFKKNNGFWKLKKIDSSTTSATYSLSVEFKRFVPQMVIDSMVVKQLPTMMEAFHQRILENSP